MRLKLISCEIFFREMCAAVARSPHQVDIEFLSKGLHDQGAAPMRQTLQNAIDQVDSRCYDAVLMGYGLCGTGLAGIIARTLPVVLPRAHDCITLFLGSRERYLEYFQNNPGAYFKTTGWIERGEGLRQLGADSIQGKTGVGCSLDELVAKYGEENGRYLYEQLGDHTRNYGKLTFIEMGVEPDDRFERRALEEATQRNWKFEKLQGDMSLIERLVNGVWEETEFLVLSPGTRVVVCHDGSIIGGEATA